jgi:hypothetical protein
LQQKFRFILFYLLLFFFWKIEIPRNKNQPRSSTKFTEPTNQIPYIYYNQHKHNEKKKKNESIPGEVGWGRSKEDIENEEHRETNWTP